MSENTKGRIYLITLIALFFYISTSYNACSEVEFQESLNSPARVEKALQINHGATYTNDNLVTLSLMGGFAEEMFISNDSDCTTGAWEPYVSTKSWTLANSNSQVSVYVKYREEVAESECVSDDIIHDDIAPNIVFQNVQDVLTASADASIQFIASDNLSGVKNTECALGLGSAFTPCTDVVNLNNLAEGNHDLWVRAQDKAGNEAQEIDYRWVVDTTKPTLVINSGPAATVNTVIAEFVFSADDQLAGIDRVECRLDNGAYLACNTQTTHTYSNVDMGARRAYFRAIDKAGNVSDDTLYSWVVDLTAPTVQITKSPSPLTNSTDATFEFVGIDGAAVINNFMCQLSKDGSILQAYTNCTSPKDYALLSQATYSFEVKGTDSAGNESAAAKYDWVIDTTAPSISFTNTPAEFTSTLNASFLVDATDDLSGIDKIQCQIDDANSFIDCTNPYAFQNIAAGQHTVYFKAIDKSGNESAVISYSWFVDLTKPVVTIDPNASVETLVASDSATITFAATDGESGVDQILCRLDAEQNFSACSSPGTYSLLADGDHIFYVKAIDKVGNESDIKTHLWKVDTQGPSITITAPTSVFSGQDASILYTLDDGAGSGINNTATICYYDATITNLCSANTQLVFPNQQTGTHSFRVVAQDNLGNQSAKEVLWEVVIQVNDINQAVNIDNNTDTDILFVVDNSGSMKPEHQSLAQRINGFLNTVTDLNWQIAVTSTDVTSYNEGRKGSLWPLVGLQGQYILDQNIPATQGQQILADTILNTGINGSSSERGIEATYMSFEKRFSGNTDNQTQQLTNFYRDNSHLAVILISDEEESASEFKNQPQNLIDLKNTYWPNKNFLWNSIIVKPTDTACYDLQQSQVPPPSVNNVVYGFKYEALSQLTNGLIGSVCEDDYTAQLQGIGQKILDLQKSVTLQCAPLDTDENGTPEVQILFKALNTQDFVNFTQAFTLQGLQVTFTDTLPAGDYQFIYSCIAP